MMNKKLNYINNKGFALIITLWVMVIIVSIIISIAYITRLELRKSRYQVNKLKAFYLARAGIEKAISELYRNDFIVPNEFMYEEFDLYNRRELGDGCYWVRIEDENAKLNLNTLAQYRLNLLRPLDRTINKKEIVDGIFDWLDTDSNPRPYGAEESYYQFLYHGYNCKNGLLDTIEELRLIKGVDEETFKVLKKYLTVATNDSKININTTSLDVLETLPKVSKGKIQELLYERDSHPFKTREEIEDFFGEKIYKEVGNLIRLTSDTFRITCVGFVGNTYKEIEAIINVSPTSAPRIIYWQEKM